MGLEFPPTDWTEFRMREPVNARQNLQYHQPMPVDMHIEDRKRPAALGYVVLLQDVCFVRRYRDWLFAFRIDSMQPGGVVLDLLRRSMGAKHGSDILGGLGLMARLWI
jgi:hypothetical protein